MPEPELAAALRSCCGSESWVRAMSKERREKPASFASLAALQKRGAELLRALPATDWDEAFRAHPRIGEQKAEATQSATASSWSKTEQASVDAASSATRDQLRQANAAYEQKFGRIYIVCATGKTPEQMLAIAQERMQNDPSAELQRAAEEQRKITDLRLEKLVLR